MVGVIPTIRPGIRRIITDGMTPGTDLIATLITVVAGAAILIITMYIMVVALPLMQKYQDQLITVVAVIQLIQQTELHHH